MTLADVIGELRSGMTIGIGGWGSRRKPMALVRALAASGLSGLTIVSYGGPDVGLLVAAGKVRRVVTGFVSLDSIPLEPHFRQARQRGSIELTELDEGMLHWGLLAAAHRLPFLPMRAGLGSDVLRVNPHLRTGAVAVRGRRGVRGGAGAAAGCRVRAHEPGRRLGATVSISARIRTSTTCTAWRPSALTCRVSGSCRPSELMAAGPLQSLLINRAMVAGVVETPNGAHFTSCVPDYDRDEAFQADRDAEVGRESGSLGRSSGPSSRPTARPVIRRL